MVDVIVSRAVLWFATLVVTSMSYLRLSQTKMTKICVLEKLKEKKSILVGPPWVRHMLPASGQAPSLCGDRGAHRVEAAALRQAFGAQVED